MFQPEKDFEEYGMFVFKYLMSLCGNADLAEELTQETFYRAIRSSGKFDGNCKVSTWLCQIAKNTYYSYLPNCEAYLVSRIGPAKEKENRTVAGKRNGGWLGK